MAKRRGASVSTEKRLEKTDPRYPRKVKISDQRVGFVEAEVNAYFAALVAERDAVAA